MLTRGALLTFRTRFLPSCPCQSHQVSVETVCYVAAADGHRAGLDASTQSTGSRCRELLLWVYPNAREEGEGLGAEVQPLPPSLPPSLSSLRTAFWPDAVVPAQTHPVEPHPWPHKLLPHAVVIDLNFVRPGGPHSGCSPAHEELIKCLSNVLLQCQWL